VPFEREPGIATIFLSAPRAILILKTCGRAFKRLSNQKPASAADG
jgi:hypothetical protein